LFKVSFNLINTVGQSVIIRPMLLWQPSSGIIRLFDIIVFFIS